MGEQVRFDDTIATLLSWKASAEKPRVRIWLHLADLLGRSSGADAALLEDAVARLIETEGDVPPEDRRRIIAQLDLSRSPREFLAYLERDREAYGDLLPLAVIAPLSVTGRELVEAWSDGEEVEGRGGEEGECSSGSQIADLLARIDAFQARRDDQRISGFFFEIDAMGALRARDGADALAQCTEPPQGVDGQVAGAWRSGTHFTDARLTVERGPYAGEWRISGDPQHDQAGRTIGYRGVARTPRPDETAVVLPALVAPAPRIDASRLDAAIDNLRDPLEAIVEAADPEALPPGEIRVAASEVASRSAALVAAIDTLELAVAAAGDGGLDTAALLVRIDSALRPLAEARGLKIRFRLARSLPPVDADPQAVERMVARLIGAVVSLGRRNEQIVARLGRDRTDGRMLALSVTRPGRLTGWPSHALLDPPPLQDADAPELGLGFALRLVDRLSQEAGGRLVIHDDRIVLSLPLSASPHTLQARRS